METVTVASKLPNGLILQVWDMVPIKEAVQGGPPRDTVQARPRPDRFKINGNAVPIGKRYPEHMRDGVALTFGVPADLWERWHEQNKDNAFVRNKLIYATDKGSEHEREVTLLAIAKECENIRSGFEPIELLPNDNKTLGVITSAR